MNPNTNNQLVIAVPCYNEEAVLPETNRKLLGVLSQMDAEKLVASNSTILYIDDGSTDKTWEIISQLHEQDGRVCGLKLAGNRGHQNALLAGLLESDADMMLSIDADLQDDINVIPEMVRQYRQGVDVVYGVRKERKTDTFFKRTTAQAFYKLMRRLGDKRIIYNHADFRLMSRRCVEQLRGYKEVNLFLRGVIPSIGLPSTVVYYDRAERLAGESKYPFRKMLNFALDGITSFSIKPLRHIFFVGLLFILVALGIFAYVIAALVKGTQVQGWASLMISIWFVGGCVLVCLSIIAEYVGKIYMEEKGRPRYIIEQYLK